LVFWTKANTLNRVADYGGGSDTWLAEPWRQNLRSGPFLYLCRLRLYFSYLQKEQICRTAVNAETL
jgi:hypothetical protein